MVLRRNRRDGSRFWGCRSYSAGCKGTRDYADSAAEPQSEDTPETVPEVSVRWNDATLDRPGWPSCRYTTAGGRLRSSPTLARISNEFRQCWIARTWEASTASREIRRVTGSVRKVIQRGSNPPIHPITEKELLSMLGFEKNLRLSPLQGDLSVRLEPDVFQHLSDRSLSLPDADFEFDDSVRLDSDYERQFVCWVMENLGQDAARWLTPQASFDALTAVLGDSEPSGRRVDFLVHAPFGDPFVVEIDGPQHEDSQSPDRERDRRLGEVGIEVVRIPTAEIEQSAGVNLERVKELWGEPRPVMDEKTLKAALTPVSLHRLAIALLDAVEGGFLRGTRWVVEVEDEPKIATYMLWPYMRLFKAMDQLWGPRAMPEEVLLKTSSGWTRFDVRNNRPPEPCDAPDSETDLIVRLQPYLTSIEKLHTPKKNVPEIVIRCACLPVKVPYDLFDLDSRANLPTIDPQKMEPALTGSATGGVCQGELPRRSAYSPSRDSGGTGLCRLAPHRRGEEPHLSDGRPVQAWQDHSG